MTDNVINTSLFFPLPVSTGKGPESQDRVSPYSLGAECAEACLAMTARVRAACSAALHALSP